MKKRVSTKAVMDGLTVALAKHRHMERQLKDGGSSHPQVVLALARITGMADAFQAALEALQANPGLLNIYKE
jgi:hypothetical protein